jgi:hypothetical protein
MKIKRLIQSYLFEAEGHCQDADTDDAVGHGDDRLKLDRHFYNLFFTS